MAMHEVSPSK